MTDREDDLDDLKAAMTAATPAPDPARQRQTLSQAQAAFARRQAQSQPTGGGLTWLADLLSGRVWAGLATTATALIAVGVLMLPPEGPPAPSPASLSAPAPDAALQGEASVASREGTSRTLMATPEVLSDTPATPEASGDSPRTTGDPWAALAADLSAGRLPSPEAVSVRALVNALDVPALPPASYAVPWNPDVRLADSGDPSDPDRFSLQPAAQTAVSDPDAWITFVIAAAGFAERLRLGEDIDGWDTEDALALAESVEVGADQSAVRIAMRDAVRLLAD